MHLDFQTIHTLLDGGLLTVLTLLFRVGTKIFREMKAHKVAMKELLADLARRNPEAFARIISAMDDKSVREFIIQEEERIARGVGV